MTTESRSAGETSSAESAVPFRYGVLLLLGTCLPVAGAVVVTPVLPAIHAHFASVPGVDAMTPLVVGIPSLTLALVAPIAGVIADLTGRRLLLVSALIAYAVAGTAPVWLSSLGAIIASRALLGVAEAAVIVGVTVLLCDLYAGEQRDRYLGLQTVVAKVGAMVSFAVGGMLGAGSWRSPFWVFAGSLLLIPLMRALPARRPVTNGPEAAAGNRFRPTVPWRRLLPRCAVTLVGAVVLNGPVVETVDLINGLGVTSTQTIGGVAALTGLATVVGTTVFIQVVRANVYSLLIAAFGLVGVGCGIVAAASLTVLAVAGSVTVAGLVIACVGCGLLLPTLLTWAMRVLDHDQRGRGTGVWVASFFLGQFLCPLVMIMLSRVTGGMAQAFGVLTVASLLMAAGLTWGSIVYGTRRPVAQFSSPGHRPA